MKIVHEKSKCIGCGVCAAVCPRYWEIDEKGKAHLIGSELDNKTQIEILEIKKSGCNKQAIDVCPVQCILIET